MSCKDCCPDFGLPGSKLQLWLCSSSAKAISTRRGAGNVRHIVVYILWLQSKARSGEIAIKKVLGTEDCADLGTKVMSTAAEVEKNLLQMGDRFAEAIAVPPRLAAQ